MKAESQKLSKTLSGVSGEYFVAAELSRRGFIAAVTLRNSRGIDLLVSRVGGKRAATIQVKTLQSGNQEWLLSKDDDNPKSEDHFYVFVALNGVEGNPEYHVVPGSVVSEESASNHKLYLSKNKKDGTLRKDTAMRTFRPGERFRGKWGTLTVHTGGI